VTPGHNPVVPREVGGTSCEAVYPDRTPAAVYSAAFRAATELGFAVTHRDDAAMALGFRTVGATTSWPGAQMRATIHPRGDATQLMVACTSLAGYRLLMAEWHAAKALGFMFLDRVTSLLPTMTEPPSAAPPPPVPIDQLKSLGDLRDRGLLTEEEFAAAKQRLLG
jgi:Short C-terminal domain